MKTLSASAFALLVSSVTSDVSLLTKFLVPNSNCIDGSSGGYYGPDPDISSNTTTRLVVFLNGGGACTSKANCESWAKSLGSSDKWPNTKKSGTPLHEEDCEVNPDWCDALKVVVPYCTGDVHSGNRSQPAWDDDFGYFSGHRNVVSVFADILSKYEVGNVKEVLLSGGSAGGFGTFLNIDYVRSLFSHDVVVKGSPLAGYFIPGELPGLDSDTPWMVSDFAHQSKGETGNSKSDGAVADLWGSVNISQACVDDLGDEYRQCQSAHVAATYIETPLFWAQNQFDTNQIFSGEGAPQDGSDEETSYIKYFGEATLSSMKSQLPGKDGAFVPSCLDHVGMKSKIGEDEYYAALGDWYFERRTDEAKVYDDCVSEDGLPCGNCKKSEELWEMGSEVFM